MESGSGGKKFHFYFLLDKLSYRKLSYAFEVKGLTKNSLGWEPVLNLMSSLFLTLVIWPFRRSPSSVLI